MLIVLRAFVLVLSAISMTACVSNPPYTFAKDEKKALLKGPGVSMCRDGHFYNLSRPDGSDATPIPVGSRLTLGNFMYFSGYNVSYSCYPFLSFLPKEGETYVVNGYIRENKCFIELVREDQTKETGLTFESSVGPRDCYEKK